MEKPIFQLRYGLRKDRQNNLYFPVYDSVTDMHKYTDKIYITGVNNAFLLRDYIDTTSFYRFKNFPFAKDKKHVYLIRFCNDENLDKDFRIIEGADPMTFTITPHSQYEARDKNSNYYYKKSSLEIISKAMKYNGLGKGFYKGDNGKLYIKTNVMQGGQEKWSKLFYMEVPDIDISSYRDFGQATGYSRDKNNVYWCWGSTDGSFIEIVEKADPATFKVDTINGYGHGYDKNYKFYNGYIEKEKLNKPEEKIEGFR